MTMFEIYMIDFNREQMWIDLIGYTETIGYNGKKELHQKRARFYYHTLKSRLFTQKFIKAQKQAQGAKTVIEAFQSMVGTKILIWSKQLRALD